MHGQGRRAAAAVASRVTKPAPSGVAASSHAVLPSTSVPSGSVRMRLSATAVSRSGQRAATGPTVGMTHPRPLRSTRCWTRPLRDGAILGVAVADGEVGGDVGPGAAAEAVSAASPVSRSLPSPPPRASLPDPALSTSVPSPPQSTSALMPPVKVSLPSLPRSRFGVAPASSVSAPVPPTLTAICAVPVACPSLTVSVIVALPVRPETA